MSYCNSSAMRVRSRIHVILSMSAGGNNGAMRAVSIRGLGIRWRSMCAVPGAAASMKTGCEDKLMMIGRLCAYSLMKLSTLSLQQQVVVGRRV